MFNGKCISLLAMAGLTSMLALAYGDHARASGSARSTPLAVPRGTTSGSFAVLDYKKASIGSAQFSSVPSGAPASNGLSPVYLLKYSLQIVNPHVGGQLILRLEPYTYISNGALYESADMWLYQVGVGTPYACGGCPHTLKPTPPPPPPPWIAPLQKLIHQTNPPSYLGVGFSALRLSGTNTLQTSGTIALTPAPLALIKQEIQSQ